MFGNILLKFYTRIYNSQKLGYDLGIFIIILVSRILTFFFLRTRYINLGVYFIFGTWEAAEQQKITDKLERFNFLYTTISGIFRFYLNVIIFLIMVLTFGLVRFSFIPLEKPGFKTWKEFRNFRYKVYARLYLLTFRVHIFIFMRKRFETLCRKVYATSSRRNKEIDLSTFDIEKEESAFRAEIENYDIKVEIRKLALSENNFL